MGLVYGAGIYESGKHVGSHGTKNSFGYKVWQNMLKRCYCEKFQEQRPTYKGCTASREFIEFQKFMDWAEVQVGYGNCRWCLDKDLLVRGNRMYSPDTCVFIPPQINTALNLVKSRREAKGLPIGVFLDKRDGSYYSTITEWPSQRLRRLGTFSTVTDTFDAYKKAKEAKLRALASHFKGSIDSRAHDALTAYEVHICD